MQIFTYFPHSAPITALLRNWFGSLNLTEAGLVVAILFLSSAIMLNLAVKLLPQGSIRAPGSLPFENEQA